MTREGLSRARADSAYLYGAQSAMGRTWGQTFTAIWTILSTLTFTVTVLCLSSLYFVVTSVQFWATDYLINGPQRYHKDIVMLCFIITSATGPIAGVIFGGWTVDAIGGYRGSPLQRFRCVSLVTAFALVANCFAFSATYWPGGGMWFVMGCLWFLLFFGMFIFLHNYYVYIIMFSLFLFCFGNSFVRCLLCFPGEPRISLCIPNSRCRWRMFTGNDWDLY